VAALAGSVTDWNLHRQSDKYFSGQVQWTNLTGTRQFFDKMIGVLKIIKAFLSQDLGFSFMLNLDIGLAISKASLGALAALLTALQQMMEDRIYYQLLAILDKYVREELRQCIPFERMLRILADWMTGPDGLFKYIAQYVDSYLSGFSDNMNFGYNLEKKKQLLDLTAIDKLIALLEKLRDAMLNLELCVEADFRETPMPGDDIGRFQAKVGAGPSNFSDTVQAIRGNQDTTYTGKIIYPTDTEIKAFITNRLGESEAFADQVLQSAKMTSLETGGSSTTDGDLVANFKMAIGDCARTLDAGRIEEVAKLIADWEVI
jgi:hypothetical protein